MLARVDIFSMYIWSSFVADINIQLCFVEPFAKPCAKPFELGARNWCRCEVDGVMKGVAKGSATGFAKWSKDRWTCSGIDCHDKNTKLNSRINSTPPNDHWALIIYYMSIWMTSKKILYTAVLLLSFHFASTAREGRLALVIGNSDYEYVTQLKNPINDA